MLVRVRVRVNPMVGGLLCRPLMGEGGEPRQECQSERESERNNL